MAYPNKPDAEARAKRRRKLLRREKMRILYRRLRFWTRLSAAAVLLGEIGRAHV